MLWRPSKLLSPLQCTDTKSLDLKSFRFHSYKKMGRVPPLLYLFNFHPFSPAVVGNHSHG